MRIGKTPLMTLLFVTVAGCGTPRGATETAEEKGPAAEKFADEREELAYLKSLANPTPEQFRRRKELDGKLTFDAMKRGWDKEAAEADRDIKQHLAAGKEHEAKGDGMRAIREYRMVIDDHPNHPEAKAAEAAIKRLGGSVTPGFH